MFLFSLNKCPRMELLDHMIAQFLIFWSTSILFFIVAELIYIPKAMYEGSLFSISLPTCVISGLFDNSHSDRYKVVSYCGFHLHFPGNYWYRASFHVPVGHWYIFFGKKIYSDPLSIFKNGLFIYVELYKVFVYVGYWPFVRYIICKYILSFSRWFFLFCWWCS